MSEDLNYVQRDRTPGNIFGHHVDVNHESEFYNLPYLLDIDKDDKKLHFKCNCSTRNTVKNIDINSKVYVYKIQDVCFHNPNYSDNDF